MKTNNDYAVNDKEIAVFIKELQNQIPQMDYSVPDGTTVIAYTGKSNNQDINAWEVVAKVSKVAGDNAVYISNLPARELIGKRRDDLEAALENIVGDYEQLENTLGYVA